MKQNSSKQFSNADLHHLSMAEGWLGLGDLISADQELDQIQPIMRSHPTVLAVRYNIYVKREKWSMAVEIAETLIKLLPNDSASWIWLAYSVRRSEKNGINRSKAILLDANRKFPKNWTILYNLACYCSQLGDFEDSVTWLKRAMQIAQKEVQQMAIDDPDFKPLWDNMGGTLWKRE